VFLTREKFNDKLYVRWSSFKKGLGYDDAAYQLLIENFKRIGLFTDADNCYYAFRKEQFLNQNQRSDAMIYLFNGGAWLSYGFGKRPLYPLIWSIIIIALYTGIWISIGSKDSRDEVDEYAPIKRWPQSLSDAIIFSATVFLSGTKLFVDPPAIPEINGVSRSFIKKAFTIERLLGALFSVLFFLAVTGMIIKST
jgi:hypothetical protein